MQTQINIKESKNTIVRSVIFTPIWTNQPSISPATLDPAFVNGNINRYFVTLKNTNGSALSAGQFKLTLNKDGYAAAINQIFTLTNLATGNAGTLGENREVEFKEVGSAFLLRNAGVNSIKIDLPPELQNANLNVEMMGRITQGYYTHFAIAPFRLDTETRDYIFRAPAQDIPYLGYGWGFGFPAGTIGFFRKHIHMRETVNFYRHEKTFSAIASKTYYSNNGTTLNHLLDRRVDSTPPAMYLATPVNIDAHSMNVPVTDIYLWTDNQGTYLNGFEVVVKELR